MAPWACAPASSPRAAIARSSPRAGHWKGKGGFDEKIAEACTLVYEDEVDHMLAGIANIGQENLSDADWTLLGELVVAQMQQRIRMRNAQFGLPLSEQRVAAIFNGEIEPTRFDYQRAGLAA